MKKLFILLIFASVVWGCGKNATHKNLETIDSLIGKDLIDSAKTVIGGLSIEDVDDKSVLAYYNMLSYQIEFRLGNIPENDSLINYSIDYYKARNDKEKLTRSYYYKGRIVYKRGLLKEGVVYLKEAEEYSKDIDDYVLKSRIENILANWNLYGGESVLALVHGKQAVKYAELSDDKERLLYSLTSLMVIYESLDMDDSAWYYKDKCPPLIPYIPEKDRAVFLANMANDYAIIGTEKAKDYAFQSLKIKELASTYRVLSDIYIAEKNMNEAERSLKRGLEICDDDLQMEVNLLNDMSELKHLVGETDEAARLSKRVIAMSDSLQRKWDNDSIKEAQHRFKAQKDSQNSKDKISEISITASVIVVVLLVGSCIVVYYNVRKRRKAKLIIDGQQEQINDQQEQISSQQDKITDYEKEAAVAARRIEKLADKEQEYKRAADNLRRNMKNMEKRHDRNIEEAQQCMAERVAKGHELWKILYSGGKMVAWTKEERDLFIEYYKTIKPEFARQSSLSQSMLFYNMLLDMGKTEEDILAIMGLTLSALRTMKSRMKKENTDNQDGQDNQDNQVV